MGIENFGSEIIVDEPTVEVKNEILKKNLNTLLEIFQIDERHGKYKDMPEDFMDMVIRIIQKNAEVVEGRNIRIGDPEAFLSDVRTTRDRLLEASDNDEEKAQIQDLFSHVYIAE